MAKREAPAFSAASRTLTRGAGVDGPEVAVVVGAGVEGAIVDALGVEGAMDEDVGVDGAMVDGSGVLGTTSGNCITKMWKFSM